MAVLEEQEAMAQAARRQEEEEVVEVLSCSHIKEHIQQGLITCLGVQAAVQPIQAEREVQVR
jgi:hypothetical protein